MGCARCCSKIIDTIPIPRIERSVHPRFERLFPEGSADLKVQAREFDLSEKNIRNYAVGSNATLFGLKLAMIALFFITIVAYLGSKVWHHSSLNGGKHLGMLFTVNQCAMKARSLYIGSIVFATLSILVVLLHVYLKHRFIKGYSELTAAHNNNINFLPFILARALTAQK